MNRFKPELVVGRLAHYPDEVPNDACTYAVADVEGKAAVERSQELVAPYWKRISLPFVLLTIAPRLVVQSKAPILAAIPERLWSQVRSQCAVVLLVSRGSTLSACRWTARVWHLGSQS